MKDSTALAQQKMPAPGRGEAILPTRAGRSGLGASDTLRMMDASALGLPATVDRAAGLPSDTDDASLASIFQQPKLATHIIGQQVADMVHSDTKSVSVVLRLDADTNLFLRLQMQDGTVHVKVSCERIDWHLLQADWPDLQKSLGQQGIRLGSLSEPDALVGNDGGQSQQHQHQRQDASAQDSHEYIPWRRSAPVATASTPAVGIAPLTTTSTARKPGLRAWESWA